MSKAISEKIDPNRMPKQPFGLKAESTLQRITFTPSSANPGETLYVNIPKLSGNNVLVPGSVRLSFNLVVTGHANNHRGITHSSTISDETLFLISKSQLVGKHYKIQSVMIYS